MGLFTTTEKHDATGNTEAESLNTDSHCNLIGSKKLNSTTTPKLEKREAFSDKEMSA